MIQVSTASLRTFRYKMVLFLEKSGVNIYLPAVMDASDGKIDESSFFASVRDSNMVKMSNENAYRIEELFAQIRKENSGSIDYSKYGTIKEELIKVYQEENEHVKNLLKDGLIEILPSASNYLANVLLTTEEVYNNKQKSGGLEAGYYYIKKTQDGYDLDLIENLEPDLEAEMDVLKNISINISDYLDVLKLPSGEPFPTTDLKIRFFVSI